MPHIGHIYNLTGPEAADLDHYACVFSEVLGRTIRYRDTPTSEWNEKLRAAALPEHVAHHLTVMTELHKQGRYDRMSEDYLKLTGETPTSRLTGPPRTTGFRRREGTPRLRPSGCSA